MTDLEEENVMLRSMCRRAAQEIEEHWEAHCDDEGYGPCNLVSRLREELPPAWYPGFLTEEEAVSFDIWLEEHYGR